MRPVDRVIVGAFMSIFLVALASIMLGGCDDGPAPSTRVQQRQPDCTRGKITDKKYLAGFGYYDKENANLWRWVPEVYYVQIYGKNSNGYMVYSWYRVSAEKFGQLQSGDIYDAER
jgi:hypothetical protein